MRRSISNNNTNTQNIDVIATKIEYIQQSVDHINAKLDADYATKDWVNAEFGQTRKLVNAILITFGTAIVLAFATFVIKGGLV
jgi:hypothetical protein